MRYMLGQFCHRRMFIFTWNSTRAKWTHLSRVVGTSFAIFDWDTMYLNGVPGKQDGPGRDLHIEPGSYDSLHQWVHTRPPTVVIEEFVTHFLCMLDAVRSTGSAPRDPMLALEELMELWDKQMGLAT